MSDYDSLFKELERKVEKESKRLKWFEQLVDKDLKQSDSIKMNIMKYKRDAKSYRNIIKSSSQEELQQRIDILSKRRQVLAEKREKLRELRNSLEEFEGVEPTNESLRDRIEDLKSSRLSLEMTFSDY